MATASVTESSKSGSGEDHTPQHPLNWYASSKEDLIYDEMDQRIDHAEALSQIIGNEMFFEWNEAIQSRVLALLSRQLTEIRECWQEVEKIRCGTVADSRPSEA